MSLLQDDLQITDPQISNLINKEQQRQKECLELIASENFTSRAVMQANGSILTNKYSEGLPKARYYGGNEHIDDIEVLCQQRALHAFNLDNTVWGVNVQSYSGSIANFAIYTALLEPKDRLMGLALSSGGHLTHGFQTPKSKVSASAIYFESHPYHVNPTTGLLDYDEIEKQVLEVKPKILICGASAYPRDWDYARLRTIANLTGAYLFADISHIGGLVATGEQNDPFPYCDIVSTTTHKTLRGPRAALIFYRKDPFEKKINNAVFPAMQGGPHNNAIAAVAVALKQVVTPEFKAYIQQVKKNAKVLAETLMNKGHKIVTDGTDNHLLLWDLRPLNINGSCFEKLCDAVNITLNKNTINGDTSAMNPNGVRIGTPALTSRSFVESDFEKVADFLDRCATLTQEVCAKYSTKSAKQILKILTEDDDIKKQVTLLRNEITQFASLFPLAV
jgi:glycine hydroxymethyltransferase